jgi:hypothetical protein
MRWERARPSTWCRPFPSGLGEIKKNRQVYEAFWARSHTIAQLAMLIADERQPCATSCPIKPTWPASSTIAAYPC